MAQNVVNNAFNNEDEESCEEIKKQAAESSVDGRTVNVFSMNEKNSKARQLPQIGAALAGTPIL